MTLTTLRWPNTLIAMFAKSIFLNLLAVFNHKDLNEYYVIITSQKDDFISSSQKNLKCSEGIDIYLDQT